MKSIIAVALLLTIFSGIFCSADAEAFPPVFYEARLMTLEEISTYANKIYRPTVYVVVTFDESGEVSLNVFLDDGDKDPSNEYRVNHVILEANQWAIVDGQIFVNGEVLYRIAEHAGNI